ncbi:porin [Pseudochrobactrum sp. MP213Fo]|uniref:porin n=1 Tax=Pseudochrobactrum sp. MP213Fo TaxID=3022250 RepID=UPI003BA1BD91
MNIKSLLLGSAAALVAATTAQAADAIVAPEPEAVEYVRVCDAYGAGYFYIPGTETCLRISGYVRYDAKAGDDVYAGGKRDTWGKNARFTLRTHTASETELGTLKTYTENRFEFGNSKDDDGVNNANFKQDKLKYAYIELGGLRVGKDESAFQSFTGYLGNVMNDDVVAPGGYDTNLISYTFTGGNGFSAIISAEQGEDYYAIDDYMPHVVGGVKFEQAWGSIAAAAAYDALLEEWAGKVRLDVNVTDAVSLWVQGAYSSYEEDFGMYGNWGGDYAVWGGLAFKASDKATFNIQGAYEDWGKTAVTANVAYKLVPGFTITPEVSYTTWSSNHPDRLAGGEKDAFGGMIRFQRSF